jgi:hypothetical protein
MISRLGSVSVVFIACRLAGQNCQRALENSSSILLDNRELNTEFKFVRRSVHERHREGSPAAGWQFPSGSGGRSSFILGKNPDAGVFIGRGYQMKFQEIESKRLAALVSYDVMDSPREEVYDDFTRLVAHVFDVPIALISLLDESRQWFKSKIGIDTCDTARELAFCNVAIQQEGAFVVHDATKSPEFRDNPLVTGEPQIRFYAGATLLTPDGLPIGTLCAIDTKPRYPSAEQIEALQALSRQVMVQFELRRVSRQLADSVANVRTLEGLIPICMHCHGMRDIESGEWKALEDYLADRTAASLSHGICDECIELHYPSSGAASLRPIAID